MVEYGVPMISEAGAMDSERVFKVSRYGFEFTLCDSSVLSDNVFSLCDYARRNNRQIGFTACNLCKAKCCMDIEWRLCVRLHYNLRSAVVTAHASCR